MLQQLRNVYWRLRKRQRVKYPHNQRENNKEIEFKCRNEAPSQLPRERRSVH